MQKTSSTNSELPESRKHILESKINGNGVCDRWILFLAQAYPCMMAMLLPAAAFCKAKSLAPYPCVDVCHDTNI
jgi:hypothetical protein